MTYDGTDANDDGVVEANVDNQEVSTDDLTATESFDSVRSNSWPYVWYPTSQDGLATSTNGSGAIRTLEINEQRARTGTTIDSFVRINDDFTPVYNAPSWDKDRVVRLQISVDDVTEIARFATGRQSQGITDTFERLSFLFTAANGLEAEAATDSNRTTEQIDANPTAGDYDLGIVYTAGEKAEYYVNGFDGTPDATITTNLPSGTTWASNPWGMAAKNPDGVDFDIGIYCAEVTQLP